MIKYEYEFIINMKSNYTIEPSKFEELKKHAIPLGTITKKQQQTNIKYQSNKWRYNDKEDMFKKKINGVLNKISFDNYDELCTIIQNIGNNISIDKYIDFEYFVEKIINKIIIDPFYSDVYGKLLKDLCKYKWYCINANKYIDSSYISFFELLLIKVKELYDDIYNGINTNKQNCINIILLINQLYLNNILSNHIFISCIYGLLNNPTELNIELISKILIKCGKKIYKNEIDKIMEKNMIIYKNIKNTRLKYMLLDIIELYENNWEVIIRDNKEENDIDDKILGILDEFILNESNDDILYILENYSMDSLVKFIEVGIKFMFNQNKEKQLLLLNLITIIIKQKTINNKHIEKIIDKILNEIEDIIIDSPKSIDVLMYTFNKFLEEKFIIPQILSNIISLKTNNIKKLLNNYIFNNVKKKVKK
jgi:hypothetical protein